MANVCAMCGAPGSHRHHIWTRGAGCPEIDGTTIGLCHQCHNLVHADPEPAFLRGVLAMAAAMRHHLDGPACVQESLANRDEVWRWRRRNEMPRRTA